MKVNTDKDNFVIVIGRQFGCGGRAIGKQIAEAFGAKYYDKELLSQAADELGFSPEIFRQADERRPSMIRSLLHLDYGAASAFYDAGTLSNENLYNAQSEVIRHIADKDNCVIVGRTADYVLREHPGLVSVFIHAPLHVRAGEILRRGDADTLEHACDMAHKYDKSREGYYNYFTGRHWGNADNYDLSFNSARVDIPSIIRIISALLPAIPPPPMNK